MVDSFFDFPGLLDPTDAFTSSFDDLLGVGGSDFGLGGGGDPFDTLLDPCLGSSSASSSLMSNIFDSPNSTGGDSDYASSASFSGMMMMEAEDTLTEADLLQSFASPKNFAARNKVRFNSMKMRAASIGSHSHNYNSHSHHNNRNTNSYKKFEKHGGGRSTTISMANNSSINSFSNSISRSPKVYISKCSPQIKRSGGGGRNSNSSFGDGTSILLKSKRGGFGSSRNGNGGSSLISSSKTSFLAQHHQPRHRSGMFAQHQHQQPKQNKTIIYNKHNNYKIGGGSCYLIPGSSSASKGNVHQQKPTSISRNNSSSSSANRNNSSELSSQLQMQKVPKVLTPRPSDDHDYCIVYTEAMFAAVPSVKEEIDDISHITLASSSCSNVDSFLNDDLFSTISHSNQQQGVVSNSELMNTNSTTANSTEVQNDLEDLLDGFIPDDVLLNELPNCLQDLFDLDLNSLINVKSEDVLDGLNDVCNLMTDNYMDDLEELYCSTFDTSSFPTPAPTPASSPAPSASGSSTNIPSSTSLMPNKTEDDQDQIVDDESTLLVIPKDHHSHNIWQESTPLTPECLQN